MTPALHPETAARIAGAAEADKDLDGQINALAARVETYTKRIEQIRYQRYYATGFAGIDSSNGDAAARASIEYHAARFDVSVKAYHALLRRMAGESGVALDKLEGTEAGA